MVRHFTKRFVRIIFFPLLNNRCFVLFNFFTLDFMKRKIWEIPILRNEGDLDIHRKVTWLELFFDLFFVVVISSTSRHLSQEVTAYGVLSFVATFLPIWWVWIGATYYNERFETEGLENRLFTFLLMIPVAGLAMFSDHALDGNFRNYVLSYAVARGIILILWIRAGYYNPSFRPTSNRYAVGFLISLMLVIVSAFSSSPVKYILFGMALFSDFITPVFTVRHQAILPRFTRSKLPERYGLFVIIVLGEMIAGTVSGMARNAELTVEEFIIGVLGIAIGFGFWWIYFDYIGRRTFHSKMWLTLLWSYLHLPLVLSFVAVGASLWNIVGNRGELGFGTRILFTCATGFSLVVMGILESILQRDPDEPAHPVISPMLKILCGLASVALGLIFQGTSAITTLLIIFILQLIQMVYGAYVWFTTELIDTD
jgi:low temperature requirement protein LtrA